MITEKLLGKLNLVTVTDATMAYGSITIDENLMDLAGIKEYDAVEINGATTPARIRTYVLKGERGSGMIGLRGGASLHFKKGDKIHILKYGFVDRYQDIRPLVVHTDEKNQPIYEDDGK
jgi:aspartate 1-decarboxylase